MSEEITPDNAKVIYDFGLEVTKETVLPSYIPKRTIKRNEWGLICDGSVEYIYEDSGLINWRAMLPSKFLVPNRQMFEKNGKQIPKSIDALDDRELIVLLGGLRYLATIRGYTSVRHVASVPSNDYVVSTCNIDFIPNFESENRQITFSAIGDASPFNVSAFGKIYLAAFAENRAFARAVRNALRISIVSQDEISPNGTVQTSDPNTKMSTTMLQAAMEKYEVNFETIKKKLIEEKVEGADKFETVNDISSHIQFSLIERLKKKFE